jgi:O-antigen/teichoic acid export membrane protein
MFLIFPNPVTIAIAYLLGYVTATVATLRAIWDKIRAVPTDAADINTTKLVRFSTPLLLVGIVNMMTGQVDKTLLGLLSTPESVGVFNVVFTLSQNFLVVFGSLQFIFTPVFSRLHESSEKGQLLGFYRRVTRWGFYPTAVLLLFVFVFTEPLLANLFRPEYALAADSLRLLALGSAVSAILGLNSAALLSIGYSRLHLYNAILAISLNACLDYLFIPRLGVLGAAVGTVVALGATNVVYTVQLYHYTGIHPISLKLIVPAMTGLILAAISFVFSIGTASLQIRTLVFVGILAGFGLAIIGTGGIDQKDRKLAKSLSNKLRQRVGV